jgi:hypothetical protein
MNRAPSEIVNLILDKLPVRDMLPLRCVCKSLKSLVDERVVSSEDSFCPYTLRNDLIRSPPSSTAHSLTLRFEEVMKACEDVFDVIWYHCTEDDSEYETDRDDEDMDYEEVWSYRRPRRALRTPPPSPRRWHRDTYDYTVYSKIKALGRHFEKRSDAKINFCDDGCRGDCHHHHGRTYRTFCVGDFQDGGDCEINMFFILDEIDDWYVNLHTSASALSSWPLAARLTIEACNVAEFTWDMEIFRQKGRWWYAEDFRDLPYVELFDRYEKGSTLTNERMLEAVETLDTMCRSVYGTSYIDSWRARLDAWRDEKKEEGDTLLWTFEFFARILSILCEKQTLLP